MTSEDAVKFKSWMLHDEVDYKMSRPSYPSYYDRNFEFLKDRMFYLSLLMLLGLYAYGSKKYVYERDRARRTERLGNIENLPAHHFNNRGGVLV